MTPDASPAHDFPRVPAYAWSWLQRSRPVVAEVSRRLTGGPPTPGFVVDLQERFAQDPFTRDVVVAVIAEVAFKGRIPRRRPAGASWDRGLTWWAAAIAGTSPAQFEARAGAAEQSRLFPVEAGAPRPAPGRGRGPTAERAALIAALRELVRTSDGRSVPVAAIQRLIEQLGE